ncbi:MAG: transposase [Proteobacteria bacterium]|nr:transposase [Pseudomonadota bacterium]
MSKTSSFNEFEKIEVITSAQHRRRWTTAEKLQMVAESGLPGMSVSYVSRTSSSILKRKTLQGHSVYIKLRKVKPNVD